MVKWQVLETRPRELINLEFIASRHSLFCIQVKNQKGRCVLLPREAVKTFHGEWLWNFRREPSGDICNESSILSVCEQLDLTMTTLIDRIQDT